MPCILIIGDQEDPHVETVSAILKKKNARYIVLNPYKYGVDTITYNYAPLQIQLSSTDGTISGHEVTSVWWRLKPNLISNADNKSDFERQKFLLREWVLTLEPLKHFLKDSFWMNRREVDSLVRNKPYQLAIAHENDFKIPKGIISNDIGAVKDKTSKFKRFIYKPLSYFIVPPDQVLYSSFMTHEDVEKKTKNIAQAPCIFQEYIDKNFELRITVVGKKVFAVKINSQKNSKTKFDWRKDQIGVGYEIFVLPTLIQEKLLRLHRKFRLYYGAYDFIVDVQGEYHFLEVNPGGQWLWMEQILKIEISQAIADALIQEQ